MATSQGSGEAKGMPVLAGEKSAAVPMVRALRAELGFERGTVHRLAARLSIPCDGCCQVQPGMWV